jgi:hypothetical protein
MMIECPDTGKQVYTDINLNRENYESCKFGTQVLPCPECGRNHQWARADALLDETGGGG